MPNKRNENIEAIVYLHLLAYLRTLAEEQLKTHRRSRRIA